MGHGSHAHERSVSVISINAWFADEKEKGWKIRFFSNFLSRCLKRQGSVRTINHTRYTACDIPNIPNIPNLEVEVTLLELKSEM